MKTFTKAQMKTTETIIVLIIFFILLAGAMVFYAKIQSYTSKKYVEEAEEQSAIAVEQKIRHLSEILCTTDGTVVFDCYDLSKIHALQEVITDYELYYSSIIFKNSNVRITSVYPIADEIVLFAYDYGTEAKSLHPFHTPVTLYDPLSDTYNFGYITVEVYSS